MSGKVPPPPPPPMRNAPLANPLLNDAIQNVVNKNIEGAKFYLCQDVRRAPLLRRQSAADQPEIIPDPDLYTIFTALLEMKSSYPGALEPPGVPSRATMLSSSIAAFNALTRAQQFAWLNQLWAKCYDAVVPATLAQNMVEGAAAVHPTSGSMPSCLRPANAAQAATTWIAGPTPNAWALHRIGFRIEGGHARSSNPPDADLTRVRNTGISPLCTNTPAALQLVGKSYAGLDVALGTHVHLGYQNRDVYNESASCVSRTLLGATAFPKRNSDSDSPTDRCVYQYLFACQCTGLLGVDTEAWQQAQVGVNLWRPGEKAFLSIPAGNIIGYTTLERRPLDATCSWRFRFRTSTWTWVNAPSQDIQNYLNDELSCWAANQWYDVPLGYDFQF